MMDVDRWREEDGREAAALGTSTYTIDLPGDPAGSSEVIFGRSPAPPGLIFGSVLTL